MTPDTVLRIGRETLLLTLLLSALPVLAAMLVGLIISLFQAATQIQEQTLTIVPKIIVVFVVLSISGLWMLQQLVQFSTVLLEGIAPLSH
jgi:flagellar biosynthetic protein FliQ